MVISRILRRSSRLRNKKEEGEGAILKRSKFAKPALNCIVRCVTVALSIFRENIKDEAQ